MVSAKKTILLWDHLQLACSTMTGTMWQPGVLAVSLVSSGFVFRLIESFHRNNRIIPSIPKFYRYEVFDSLFYPHWSSWKSQHCSLFIMRVRVLFWFSFSLTKTGITKVGVERALFLSYNLQVTIHNRGNPKQKLKTWTWRQELKQNSQKENTAAPGLLPMTCPVSLLILPKTKCIGEV